MHDIGIGTKLVRSPRFAGDGAQTVSIVIPCFNYAGYLRQAAESALSQTGVRVEVIIVDDASTDDSVAVASSLSKADPRVRLLVHGKNSGPVRTFNDGLPLVRGDFLVRLDADDLLTPGSLARSVAVMNEYPSVGLVYGHPLHFSRSLPRPRLKPSKWTIWPGRQWLRARCRDAVNVITSPEVVMRSSIVRQVGGQKDLAHTHDMEMWFRIAAYSDVAYIHGVDQAWHRDHPRSLSAREVDHYKDLEERHAAFCTLFEGVGADLEDLEACREEAFRALAGQALVFAARDLDHGKDGNGTVTKFIEFARRAWPTFEELPEWTACRRRLGMSSVGRMWYPGSYLARVSRKLKVSYRQWCWYRNGVLRD